MALVKGSNSVELLIEYLRLNAQAAVQERPITVLPVCQLLLANYSLQRPPASLSPESKLDQVQVLQAKSLFSRVDPLQSGMVLASDLGAMWGGKSIGLFDSIALDSSGRVSAASWVGFFESIAREQGLKVVQYTLDYFDHTESVQRALAVSTRAMVRFAVCLIT